MKPLSSIIAASRFRDSLMLAGLAASLLGFPEIASAEFRVPPLTSPVEDLANIVNETDEAILNKGLQQIFKDTEIQVGILTIGSTEGLPIEQAANQVAEKWKLGKSKSDKGVLLIIATEDRSLRIDVGQGLEGVLTDAHSKRIIDQTIIPLFRTGNPSAGIVAGVAGILGYAAPDLNLNTYFGEQTDWKNRGRDHGRSGPIGPGIVIFLLFVVFQVLSMGFRQFTRGTAGGLVRYNRGLGRGGFGSFGSFGGGNGGSGGWSGGGGGFSGGGASGKW